jgi:hypothetical protein
MVVITASLLGRGPSILVSLLSVAALAYFFVPPYFSFAVENTEYAINLAVMVELPLVICNVQRGGPSTGLPTKTEQADLYQAIFGRNSDSPLPVIAAATPADCFAMAFEAVRIAVKYMTPVILLTDGYLANGAEPWNVPRFEELPPIPVTFRTDPEGFFPYLRDPQTLARPWVRPGTPGLEHRVGGIEKADYGQYQLRSGEPSDDEVPPKSQAVAEDIPTTIRQRPAISSSSIGKHLRAIAAAVDECEHRGHLRACAVPGPLPPGRRPERQGIWFQNEHGPVPVILRRLLGGREAEQGPGATVQGLGDRGRHSPSIGGVG